MRNEEWSMRVSEQTICVPACKESYLLGKKLLLYSLKRSNDESHIIILIPHSSYYDECRMSDLLHLGLGSLKATHQSRLPGIRTMPWTYIAQA